MKTFSWRAVPALVFTAIYGLGTYFPITPMPILMGSLATCLAAIFYLAYLSRKRMVSLFPLWISLCLCLGFLVLGMIRKQQILAEKPIAVLNTLSGHQPENRIIRAQIADFPQRKPYGWKFVLDLQSIRYQSGWKAFSGKIQSTYVSTATVNLKKGDVIEVSGLLEKPIGKRNPMDFDYAQVLARKHIYLTLKIKSLRPIAQSPHFLDQIANQSRTFIQSALQKGFEHPENRALMFALLVGDRSEIDETTTQQFRQTGLMHLLAVSGLHIFLLGMIVFELLRSLLNRTRLPFYHREIIRSVVTILILLLFWIVTGNSPSILRAIIMALIAILANLWQRPHIGLNALGVSAFCLLLYDPNIRYDIGFQLSYAAVLALMLVYPVLNAYCTEKRFPNKGLQKLMSSIMLSIAATLGTLPILLVHFGTVSLGGIILNIVGVPLSSVALIAGILSVIGFGISETIGLALSSAAEWLTIAFKAFTLWGYESFACLQVEYYVDNLWILISIVALLWAIAHQSKRKASIGLALLCITFNFYGFLWQPTKAPLDVLFFDVGHGDAALIQFPNGKKMLVDVGDCNEYADMGERVIVPHFKKQNLQTVDIVLITHPHADHIGGLPYILRNLKVGKVLMNGNMKSHPMLNSSLKIADSLNIPVYAVKKGDQLRIDEQVDIRILSANAKHENPNEGSIVFTLQYGITKFLFTGDAEAETENQLLSQYPQALGANVIKVGHHGSKTSSTPTFVQKATAYSANEYAVVSVSADGKHGLPDYSALIRWKEAGANVLSTAHQQAIWLASDGQEIFPIDWKKTSTFRF